MNKEPSTMELMQEFPNLDTMPMDSMLFCTELLTYKLVKEFTDTM